MAYVRGIVFAATAGAAVYIAKQPESALNFGLMAGLIVFLIFQLAHIFFTYVEID